MKLHKHLVILATFLFLFQCVYLTRTHRKVTIVSQDGNNTNNKNKAPSSKGDNGKSNKESKGAADINSQIILSRLYAYENKIHPLLVNLGILPKSDEHIPNSVILKELHKAINDEFQKEDLKKALKGFNKSLAEFWNTMKTLGAFSASGQEFKYKTNNPRKNDTEKNKPTQPEPVSKVDNKEPAAKQMTESNITPANNEQAKTPEVITPPVKTA